ncbi:Hemerythrin HHE cation binding domain-containing protein [Raineyella antarctica]|uniref:Hemerythrin HHE cation binding domain-containing protein n=1 Tax=Raineyella antarctica TaxID=1577474 RepID=A0A1G6GN29_9ACTN|nr:hemerythrin domain-containing protein [Raineyella antarctica]SDB83253.1 Hemerythrin HHE cation binding domain-containing protein [Raineyella antarctica]
MSSNEAVAEQMRHHHAHMVVELERLATELRAAALEGRDSSRERAALVAWTEDVLLPHAEEEERGTYPAAAGLPEAALLIDAMLREHVLIRAMADAVREIDPPLAAAAWGRALSATFDSHQAKENDLILPLLVRSGTVDLASLAGHHD